MIYLFDKNKKLNKALSLNHFNSAHQVKIINGSYTVDLVTPLKFTKRGTVYNHKKAFDKAVFVGHFDENDEFQLYKIRNISVDNNSLNIIGIHIFFDEAKAKTIIHDRRWRDSELRPIADFALGEIGWNLIECDVTDRYDFNIFRGSVLDFRNDAVDTYKVEMDYVIGFDGQQITSKGVRIKKRLGEETGQRFAYGSNVLKIKAEEERSEVYSAILGRGRGEESGDGFGQRIEFGDVVWSTANGDPVNKPAGQNYVELTSATDKYGYHEADGTIHPRIAVIEFDDIEDTGLLIQESWEWLLLNSVPKAVFESEVFALGNFKLGDSIGIIYKDAGIVKKARVHKVDRNLHDNRKTSFELGDYKHFKPNSINDVRKELKKQKRSTSEWITRLKTMFDADFEQVVGEINDGYVNAVAEAEAKVQASEAKMNEVITGQRDALEQEINMARQNAINEATQNAEVKKQEVQSNLDTFKGTHQQLYDDVTGRVQSVETFIGDQTEPLNAMLYNLENEWEHKLTNIDTWHYNILRGTRFDEPDRIKLWNGTIKFDESIPYYEYDASPYQGYVEMTDEIQFEQGVQYTLSFDVQTFGVKKFDYTFIIASPDDEVGTNVEIHREDVQDEGTNNNIYLFSQYRRYYIKFTPDRNILGTIRIGSNLANNVNGYSPFKLRLPYLTTTGNTTWLYHQLDNTQSLEEITRRITQLEDGTEEFIARTEFDYRTGEIEGKVRNIIETVDGRESIIANHENWITTNGSSVMQTVDEINRKVWMDDFQNPNLITNTDFTKLDNLDLWTGWSTTHVTQIWDEWLRVRSISTGNTLGVTSPPLPAKIIAGKTYTLSWEAFFNLSTDRISDGFEYCYVMYSNNPNRGVGTPAMTGTRTVNVNGTDRAVNQYEITFTAENNDDNASIMIGTNTTAGNDAWFFMRHPKLEIGDRKTSYYNAFTGFSQRADELSLMVNEVDSNAVTQSEVYVGGDGVQIGSTYIGDDEFSSIFSVSPKTIGVITDSMDLTGNLNVRGQIETIAMSAVEAEFGSLFAAQVRAGTIDVDYISGFVSEFEYLYTLNANIERLVAQTVFTNNVRALGIEAVYADLRSVNSEIMTSNIIKSNWLDVDTALFNRFTASSAFIDRLEVKAGNIRDLNTVEINTSQLNVDTIMEQGGNIAGGISIRRTDGAYAVSNGMLKNEYIVNSYSPMFMSSTPDGQNAFYDVGGWWRTNDNIRELLNADVRFNAYQFIHSARYLEIEVAYRRNETGVQFDVVSFGSSSFSGNHSKGRWLDSPGTEYHILKVDLGVPTYTKKAFYLKVTTSGQGTSSDNRDEIRFRILKIVQTDF